MTESPRLRIDDTNRLSWTDSNGKCERCANDFLPEDLIPTVVEHEGKTLCWPCAEASQAFPIMLDERTSMNDLPAPEAETMQDDPIHTKVVSMRKAGKSFGQISKELNIPKSSAANHMKRHSKQACTCVSSTRVLSTDYLSD